MSIDRRRMSLRLRKAGSGSTSELSRTRSTSGAGQAVCNRLSEKLSGHAALYASPRLPVSDVVLVVWTAAAGALTALVNHNRRTSSARPRLP